MAGPWLRSPEQGARKSIWLATPEAAGVTDGYFADCRRKQPSRAGRDDEAASGLWTISEELTS
jgi:hypothetical protein